MAWIEFELLRMFSDQVSAKWASGNDAGLLASSLNVFYEEESEAIGSHTDDSVESYRCYAIML